MCTSITTTPTPPEAWDEATGTWILQSHNDVAFPRLQTRYQLEKIVAEIKETCGWETFNAGMGVQVGIRELVRINVLECVRVGLFVVDESGWYILCTRAHERRHTPVHAREYTRTRAHTPVHARVQGEGSIWQAQGP